jgi:hypothetical protein
LRDFYIGAHASVAGTAVLTRDAARYTRIPERDRVLLYGHPEIRLFRGSRSG